ncbi:MAG: hypothetical protein MKZ70_02725 [Opitutales bacterium]|nr:hypothetical protein [Opitutales bacterium]MCH2613593.1 hypothetical protein [Opitutales bacterium]
MSHPRQSQDSTSSKVSLKNKESEETLVIESGENDWERVLSCNADGSSLTLLQEYSIPSSSKQKRLLAKALATVVISLFFAFTIYKTL